MKKKSEVFNSDISSTSVMDYRSPSRAEAKESVARLFEQLLIFDTVAIGTSDTSYALRFLISNLGINTVERLLKSGYIKLILWTPAIVSGGGATQPDGSVDESIIYGQPPIVGGTYKDDPEKNVAKALSAFNGLNKDRKKIFTKIATHSYIVPEKHEFAGNTVNLVLDAYRNNHFASLGLPFNKEPNQLDINERKVLLDLGHKALETAMISSYNLKSYENNAHNEIFRSNLSNIGKAYNVSDNTSTILKLEGLPNLKDLFLSEKLDFDQIFKIRHLSNAKHYRNWINEVSENVDATQISKEYLNQIKDNSSFFGSTGGRLIKNLSMTGIGNLLGNAISQGALGTVAGAGLGLFDEFVLGNILKGKNPSMFIEEIRREIKE